MKDCETAAILEDPFESVTDSSCCAEEFVTKLINLQEQWMDDGGWIFRGQNDATWDLIPSLFRKWPEGIHGAYEFRLVDNFIQTANNLQLEIPSNTMNFTRT